MAINNQLIQSEQVQKFQYANLGVLGFSATGTDDVVTTQLSAAAGAASPVVPHQVASDATTQGWITSAPWNKCFIQDATTKQAIDDGAGNEVYGRVTEAAAVYTLTYYAIVGGTETNVDIGTVSIDFFPVYNFDFYFLPQESLVRINGRVVGEDPSSNGRTVREQFTISTLNTIPNLTYTPLTSTTRVSVNPAGPYLEGVSYSVSGKTITWIPAGAGFDVKVGFTVTVVYNTLES